MSRSLDTAERPGPFDDLEVLVRDRNEPLIVLDHGTIRVVVLNNPSRKNALSEVIRRSLADCFAEIAASEQVRAVVLTGSGGAFSSGFDLAELKRPGGPAVVRPDPGTAVRRAGKPVIAAVDGPCFTGGLELALGASFILASERAVFADTHARVGIVPAWGMTALLPRAVGIRRARQMALTGEPVDASVALAWGLVNEVTTPAALLPRAMELAEAVVRGRERSQTAQLELLNRMDGHPLSDALDAEAAVVASWPTTQARGTDG